MVGLLEGHIESWMARDIYIAGMRPGLIRNTARGLGDTGPLTFQRSIEARSRCLTKGGVGSLGKMRVAFPKMACSSRCLGCAVGEGSRWKQRRRH